MFFYTCGVNQFWIIVFFAAVKPANNILFCIELQRPESSLRRHKLGLTDQSIRSNDDKTRFTCVHRLMMTGHSQNICRKVPDDVELISNLMPATGLKIVGMGACLPWCSISSSFQNSLMTSGHRGYGFREFWCWNLVPFLPNIGFQLLNSLWSSLTYF